MLVRRLLPADVDVLADLVLTVPGSVDPAREAARPEARVWVACAPGSDEPLGYAVCSWVLDEVEILAVATQPAARRRGAARALVGRVIDFAGELGARRVSLEVAEGNLGARSLYESMGFRVFNLRRAYYRATGENALEMELVLGAA